MTELERIIEQIKNGQAENIAKIDLGSNKIGDDGAIAFAEALKGANLPQLRWILLSNNKIGGEGAMAFAEALKEANLPNLEEIYLGLNKIGDEGAKAFAEALKEANLPNLEVIILYRNKIGDEGAKAFAEALKEDNLPHLKYIDLYRNKIGDDGAEAIANALKEANLPHLKSINLEHNQIGDEGAIALAEALKEANLPRLKFIDLVYNNIGDDGTKAIANALKESNLPHLVFSSLKGNNICHDEFKALNAASETCIKSNRKYLAEATERAKQKLQQDWYSTPTPIELALIDIEYAKLLQQVGKLKVAIDLYGAALHGFRHLAKAAPESSDIKQIVKQTTQGMLLAINKLNGEIEELKLPVFVLECFEHLNAKIFERYEFDDFFTKSGVDRSLWDQNLAGIIFDMMPSKGQPAFFLDMFSKFAATDSKDESDAYTSDVMGETGCCCVS